MGQGLLPHAKRMVSINDEIWSNMTAPKFDGEVNMGVPHDIFKPFMPAILRSFSRSCPNVNLVLHSSATSSLLEQLHAGELDVVLYNRANTRKGNAAC